MLKDDEITDMVIDNLNERIAEQDKDIKLLEQVVAYASAELGVSKLLACLEAEDRARIAHICEALRP